ncbi:hypothetical protein ACF09J_35865 [Streptomyces sp. NPDC014889]|uniref:hypothetical protein n=1 Tax=Streptomyces sp. NPDC014889 TaxID=3364928 RepID=UPI0036F64080
MRVRHAVLALGASLGLALTTPGVASAASTGSASVSSSYGKASATWTWAGQGSLTGIKLHVQDTNCNANPVYAYFKVYRSNGGTWTTSTQRYDYNGCAGSGTDHTNLSLSDTYNIKNIAIVVCNDQLGTDPCTTGSKSGANPYA